MSYVLITLLYIVTLPLWLVVMVFDGPIGAHKLMINTIMPATIGATIDKLRRRQQIKPYHRYEYLKSTGQWVKCSVHCYNQAHLDGYPDRVRIVESRRKFI